MHPTTQKSISSQDVAKIHEVVDSLKEKVEVTLILR